MIIEFPAPDRLLNLNDRMHWSKRAPIIAEWRRTAFYHGRHHANVAGWKLPLGPSIVKMTLPVRSTKTRRDPSNWAPTTKACVDGLVDAGYWPDDNDEWVTTLEPEFWTGRSVIVEIDPRREP